MYKNKKDIKALINKLRKYRILQGGKCNFEIDDMIERNKWEVLVTNSGAPILYDKSKLTMQESALSKEFKHASLLADFGLKVYLPKEDNTIKFHKSVDAVVNGVLLELKYIEGSRATAGKAYGKGLEQCKNVAIFISSSAPDKKDDYISKFRGTAEEGTHEKGLLIVFFEKTQELVTIDMKELVQKRNKKN